MIQSTQWLIIGREYFISKPLAWKKRHRPFFAHTAVEHGLNMFDEVISCLSNRITDYIMYLNEANNE